MHTVNLIAHSIKPEDPDRPVVSENAVLGICAITGIDPDQTLELIRLSMPYADLFKIGKLNHNQSGIDWRNFAWRAIALLEENQKDFYVKKDLQKFVDFPHAGLSIEEIEKRNIQFFPPHYRAYLPIQPTA